MEYRLRAVGDTFISNTVSLPSPDYNGRTYENYLCALAPSPFPSSNMLISYFPWAEHPTDPAIRFADLFLTRERCIAVDTKDLDKLLLKYVRGSPD